ncbi:MAG: hypothetical protein IT299_08620 [Dehalococcoidia bacterium]|nr:hypothetical protein [Dehalococcoidia bacterium]
MSQTILRSQVMADLAIQLSTVTPVEDAINTVRRALRVTGLTHTPLLNEADVMHLLEAIASEGGMLESIAQQIATSGLADYIQQTKAA